METGEDSEYLKIKKNPYDYICKFYEEEFPCIGEKIFSVLSLVPCSLVIPRIPSGVKETKQKINLLWLSAPGSGKSSISSEFEKIALNPISTTNITPSRLYHEIKSRQGLKTTLICPEVSVMFSDEELIKLLEGYTGEESKISRDTMKTSKEELGLDVDGVAYLSGTPKNILDQKIRDGVIGRTYPILTFFNQNDNTKIIDKINGRIGKKLDMSKKNYIHDYYKELYDIQLDKHDEINPITGYVIPQSIINEIGVYIKSLKYLSVILEKWGIHSARATEETYRLLVSHAFLNIFNREITDQKLVINHEDLMIAKRLIEQEAKESLKIFLAIERIDYYNIKNERDFRQWDLKMRESNKKVPENIKSIMKEMIK